MDIADGAEVLTDTETETATETDAETEAEAALDPAEVNKQIRKIDTVIFFIIVVALSTVLSLYSVTINRKQLVCSIDKKPWCDCLPNTFPIRFTSSFFTLCAVLYFFYDAKNAKCKKSTTCKEWLSKDINYVAALLVVIAVVLRFYDLVTTGQR